MSDNKAADWKKGLMIFIPILAFFLVVSVLWAILGGSLARKETIKAPPGPDGKPVPINQRELPPLKEKYENREEEAEVNLLYARKYLLDRGLDKAEEHLNRVLEVDPENLGAYDSRSMLHYERGEHEEGIRDCTKAIELAGKQGGIPPHFYEGPFTRRGAHYLNLGRFDEAIDDFNLVIRNRPDFAFAYYDRGRCYFSKGDFKKARKDFLKSIELDRENKFAPISKEYLDKIEEKL